MGLLLLLHDASQGKHADFLLFLLLAGLPGDAAPIASGNNFFLVENGSCFWAAPVTYTHGTQQEKGKVLVSFTRTLRKKSFIYQASSLLPKYYSLRASTRRKRGKRKAGRENISRSTSRSTNSCRSTPQCSLTRTTLCVMYGDPCFLAVSRDFVK